MNKMLNPIFNLRVVDIIDKYAIHEKDGKIIYQIIREKIEEGKIVKLNLTGLFCITSDFLYAAIGRLLSVYSKKYLNAKLKFICKDEERRKLIGLVIINSERYYFDEIHREKLLAAYKEHDMVYKDKEKKLKLKTPTTIMKKTSNKRKINEKNVETKV